MTRPLFTQPTRARPNVRAGFLSTTCATIRRRALSHHTRPAPAKERLSPSRSLGTNLKSLEAPTVSRSLLCWRDAKGSRLIPGKPSKIYGKPCQCWQVEEAAMTQNSDLFSRREVVGGLGAGLSTGLITFFAAPAFSQTPTTVPQSTAHPMEDP